MTVLKMRAEPAPCDPNDFQPCNVEGCERSCSDKPHMHEGRTICPKHAIQLAGGRCDWCGEWLQSDVRAFPSKAGTAYCIECWESEGYGYGMPPRRRDR